MEESLMQNRVKGENSTLIFNTVLVDGINIASLVVLSRQQNKIDMKLATWSPFMANSRVFTLPSFSIPNSKPSIFLFSHENQASAFAGAFILGKEYLKSSDENSISLVLQDVFSIRFLEPRIKVLKEGNVEDFYGAAVKNDKWIACYKEIGNEHKKCLVGSIDWSDGSVSAVVSEISLNRLPQSVINGQKKMGRDCSVREMKIEGVVSGPHSEVDFFITVLADCYSEVQFPYSIKIFQISSLGKLRGYLNVEEMEYPSAIQTMITSYNNLVMCCDKFSQSPSSKIQSDAAGVWNLSCHEFGLQSNATLELLGTMRVDDVEGSIAGGSPFKHLALNDFAGARVKVYDYVAGSKVRWDEHNLTNIFSYVAVDQAHMRIKNIFFPSTAIANSIVKSSYIADRSYMNEVQSWDTFILAEYKDNVCHIFTLDNGQVGWTCQRIKFSLETGKYSLSSEGETGIDPFYITEGVINDVDFTSKSSITFHVASRDSATLSKAPAILWKVASRDSSTLPVTPTIPWEADSDDAENDRGFVFVDDDYASGAVESFSSDSDSMFFSPIAMMAMAAVNIANFYF